MKQDVSCQYSVFNFYVSTLCAYYVDRKKCITGLACILIIAVLFVMMSANACRTFARMSYFNNDTHDVKSDLNKDSVYRHGTGRQLPAVAFADDSDKVVEDYAEDDSPRFANYKRGLQYMDEGNFEDAITAFENALKYGENPLDSHFKLGTLYNFVRKDPIKAKYHMEKYTQLLAVLSDRGELSATIDTQQNDENFKKAELFFHQALVDAANGDLTSAVLQLEQAVQAYPYDPIMYYNLGVLNHKLNNLDGAIDSYRKAIKIDAGYEDAFYGLGIAYQQKGDNLGAIDMYRKILQMNPKNVAVLNNAAILLEQVGMYDDAVDRYRQIIAVEPSYVRAYNNLGTILARRGDFETATGYFADAIERDPTYIEPHYNLGMIYEERGNIQKALEEYRLVFLSDSEFPGIVDKIQNLERLDSRKATVPPSAVSDPEPAVAPVKDTVVDADRFSRKEKSIVQESVEKSATSVSPYQEKEIDLKQRKTRELIDSVAKKPDSVDVYITLIEYLHSNGKLEEAFQYAEQAIERFPDNMQANMLLADIAADRNFFYRATKEYESILEKHPGYIDAHYKLSLIYVDKRNPLRDSQLALRHYKKFIDAGGTVPDVKQE